MSASAVPASAPQGGNGRRGEPDDAFRRMADCAPLMIWAAGPDGGLAYVNRPWLDFTGSSPGEALGFGWMDAVHPEDRGPVRAHIERALQGTDGFQAALRLRRHDGEHRTMEMRGAAMPGGGLVGSCLDVTDRMRAEHDARRHEDDFRRLAENIPDVIARFDRDLRALYVNRAVEQAFGLPPQALIGQRGAGLGLPPGQAKPLADAAARAFETGIEQPFELGARSRHFVGRVVPEKDERGAVQAVLVVIYDVTARALEEEKRAEALARERSARVTAESATLARDQFLAIVSHELRSPLNGIKSWTHVLENHLTERDPTVRRALAGIMIGVEHQVRLIEDLLDVTRAMSGNLGLVKQPMALLPVVVDALESLRGSALEKELRVTTDFTLGEREIHGDPDRVRQIFVNLLSNAVKFTPPGGAIHVSASREGDMARIEVRDTGTGIAPAFLPYVFDPFRQADQGLDRRSQEGLGLGLALVQRLAELHGGYATCESDGPDRGATFRVYLPLRRESGTRSATGSSASQAVGSLPSLSGIRVLLIDDQREARESLAALLSQAGAEVTTASSGQEALAHLALSDGTGEPEVIVCDIAMPGEDGYATLKRIRAWESSGARATRPRRPAVALSAFTQREDRIRALAEGFQMHLTKPVTPVELLTVVSSVARGLRL